ncbi:MAG: hypothetical protein AAGI51_08985 [Pseudomonadota bacterium]
MTGQGPRVQARADAVARTGAPEALRRALDRAAPGARATVLIHGYKYRPGDPARDPHRLLFGAGPEGAPRCADWAEGLGGLVVGFGWDAWAPHLPSLAREGRNGFAAVYARAGAAGETLRGLLEEMRARRPDLRVDMLAHSLGARVALGAARAENAGRMILLGAAEDAEAALDALPAAGRGGTEVFHVAARHNDLFDAMFEAAAPRRGGRAPRALGRAGLPAARPDWIDLQLDHPGLAAWLARRGAPLTPRSPAVCHWSFYARPGALGLYRRILEEREAWSIRALRAAGAPEGLAPRWSRLAPRLPRWRGAQGEGMAPRPLGV